MLRALGRLLASAPLTMCLGLPFASAQSAPTNAAPVPFSITRSDPALDALIAPDAKLTTVAAGFGFIDGPVWIRGRDGAPGYLLASSIIDNVVYKVTPAGKVSVFLDKAGYTGNDFANDGKFASIGRAHVLLMGPGCVRTSIRRAGSTGALARIARSSGSRRTAVTPCWRTNSKANASTVRTTWRSPRTAPSTSPIRMLACAAASMARWLRCRTPSGAGKTARSRWR